LESTLAAEWEESLHLKSEISDWTVQFKISHFGFEMQNFLPFRRYS